MTLPLIFAAVPISADEPPILLAIDWFLDRYRTTWNVLGDMTMVVFLDLTGGPDLYNAVAIGPEDPRSATSETGEPT